MKAKHEVDPFGRKSLAEQLSKTELPRFSSEMLKSRERWVKGNVNLLLRVILRLTYRGSIDRLNDIITLDSRVVSEAYQSPKDIWKET